MTTAQASLRHFRRRPAVLRYQKNFDHTIESDDDDDENHGDTHCGSVVSDDKFYSDNEESVSDKLD